MPQRGNSFYGVLYDTPHPVGAVRSLSLPCYYPPKSRWDFGGKEHRRHKLPFSEQEKGVNIGGCDAGRWHAKRDERVVLAIPNGNISSTAYLSIMHGVHVKFFPLFAPKKVTNMASPLSVFQNIPKYALIFSAVSSGDKKVLSIFI